MRWDLPVRWQTVSSLWQDGVVVEDGTPEQIFEQTQEQRTKDFLSKVL